MKGLPHVSMKDFLQRFETHEDMPIRIRERLQDVKEAVWEYNNPFPFDPVDGKSAFYFFYAHIITPDNDIIQRKDMPPGNVLSANLRC